MNSQNRQLVSLGNSPTAVGNSYTDAEFLCGADLWAVLGSESLPLLTESGPPFNRWWFVLPP